MVVDYRARCGSHDRGANLPPLGKQRMRGPRQGVFGELGGQSGVMRFRIITSGKKAILNRSYSSFALQSEKTMMERSKSSPLKKFLDHRQHHHRRVSQTHPTPTISILTSLIMYSTAVTSVEYKIV